jgi:hypothetical protein
MTPRTAPTPDAPDGYRYTPAPDWVTRATRRRFETSRPAALDPDRPGHYLADVGNFWDGPSEVDNNGDGTLGHVNPYTGERDRFDEHGWFDRTGQRHPWSEA